MKSFEGAAPPDPRNLAQLRLAVVQGSVAEEYVGKAHLTAVPCATSDAARQAVRHRDADAYLQSEPELKYEHHRNPQTRFTILPQLVAPVDFAFAFPDGSPLREKVNRGLLHLLQTPLWTDIQYSYLGP